MTPSTRRRAGALLALAVLLCPLSTSAARGDTVGDKREEAARIARQLEQQSRRVSLLAEDYDEARVRLIAIDQELAGARAKVASTDQQAAVIRRRLKEQSVEAYVRGGATQALELLADTRSSEEFAIRAQYVRTVTAGRVETLDQLRSVRQQLEEQQGRLDQALDDARAGAALAESKRKEAAEAEAAQRATLRQVQGELAGLVAAEAKRRAEEEARRVQAELAAHKAREEALAREAARQSAAREAASRSRPATTTTSRSPSPAVTSRPTPSSTTTTTAPRSGGGSSDGGSSGAGRGPGTAGAEAAIAEARRQVGKPYQYGAAGPDSFDCSGLTMWSWKAGGKSLPHSSRAQWSATSRVDVANLQPGDLVFYGDPIHHVGLYIGDGQMIEASETGTPVRYASIYRRDLVGAGRVN